MDFLVLFLFYLALVLMGVVTICICSKARCSRGLFWGGAQIFSCIIPECLQKAMQRLLHYLLHTRTQTQDLLHEKQALKPSATSAPLREYFSRGIIVSRPSPAFVQPLQLRLRNHTFVVLHLSLQGMVYTEYTWEILGYCQELEFSLYYLLLPYLLLFVNLCFFALSCVSNPGTVTKANELLLLQVYGFDEVMFLKNTRCPTCDLKKPARSKHCSVCNRCVHRFDHHCVWVNNCIGAWNARYFLIYLLTLTASAASLASVSTAFLVQLVFLSDLYQETYIDDLGHSQVVGILFLSQYLFLTFPRIVFMLGFVMILSFLLGGYLCFALYLAITNQTTNEWYRGGWARCQQCLHSSRPPSAEPRVYQNIYSHGVWSNLSEIFLPAAHYEKKKN